MGLGQEEGAAGNENEADAGLPERTRERPAAADGDERRAAGGARGGYAGARGAARRDGGGRATHHPALDGAAARRAARAAGSPAGDLGQVEAAARGNRRAEQVELNAGGDTVHLGGAEAIKLGRWRRDALPLRGEGRRGDAQAQESRA